MLEWISSLFPDDKIDFYIATDYDPGQKQEHNYVMKMFRDRIELSLLSETYRKDYIYFYEDESLEFDGKKLSDDLKERFIQRISNIRSDLESEKVEMLVQQKSREGETQVAGQNFTEAKKEQEDISKRMIEKNIKVLEKDEIDHYSGSHHPL
ncbi:hypothetical protein ACFLZV_05220 [Candidatus Margulisiibacteriota bacterium]